MLSRSENLAYNLLSGFATMLIAFGVYDISRSWQLAAGIWLFLIVHGASAVTALGRNY